MNRRCRWRSDIHDLQLPGRLGLADWLAWKPFGYAQLNWTRPAEGVVETEEDLHIFGLMRAVHGAQPSRVTKPHKCGATPPRHQAKPPRNQFTRTRGDLGQGMATGGGLPGGAVAEERWSAAVPRAHARHTPYTMGFEQQRRNPRPAYVPAPPRPPPQAQPKPQQPQQRQQHRVAPHAPHHGALQDDGHGQVFQAGGWQQHGHQQQQQHHPYQQQVHQYHHPQHHAQHHRQQQQQQQQQQGRPPVILVPVECPPAPVLLPPHQMVPVQRIHPQMIRPQVPFVNEFQGHCNRCCRYPCQCHHVY